MSDDKPHPLVGRKFRFRASCTGFGISEQEIGREGVIEEVTVYPGEPEEEYSYHVRMDTPYKDGGNTEWLARIRHLELLPEDAK